MRQLSSSTASSRRTAGSRPGATTKGEPTQAGGTADWAVTLEARIRAVGPDPERRRRVASRLIVETLLVQELGSELAADPGFQAVIDDVLSAMASSPTMQDDLARAAELLTRVEPS